MLVPKPGQTWTDLDRLVFAKRGPCVKYIWTGIYAPCSKLPGSSRVFQAIKQHK